MPAADTDFIIDLIVLKGSWQAIKINSNDEQLQLIFKIVPSF